MAERDNKAERAALAGPARCEQKGFEGICGHERPCPKHDSAPAEPAALPLQGAREPESKLAPPSASGPLETRAEGLDGAPPRRVQEGGTIELCALEADAEKALYEENAKGCAAARNYVGEAADLHGAMACRAVAERIRALAAPTAGAGGAKPCGTCAGMGGVWKCPECGLCVLDSKVRFGATAGAEEPPRGPPGAVEKLVRALEEHVSDWRRAAKIHEKTGHDSDRPEVWREQGTKAEIWIRAAEYVEREVAAFRGGGEIGAGCAPPPVQARPPTTNLDKVAAVVAAIKGLEGVPIPYPTGRALAQVRADLEDVAAEMREDAAPPAEEKPADG